MRRRTMSIRKLLGATIWLSICAVISLGMDAAFASDNSRHNAAEAANTCQGQYPIAAQYN